MELVRLSLSISLAILPSDALSSRISNGCSSLATFRTVWNTIPQSMLLLLQWCNYTEYNVQNNYTVQLAMMLLWRGVAIMIY